MQRSISSLYGDAEPSYELNLYHLHNGRLRDLCLLRLRPIFAGSKRLSGESGRHNEPKRKWGHGKCHLNAEAHHRVALGLGYGNITCAAKQTLNLKGRVGLARASSNHRSSPHSETPHLERER